MFFLYKNNVLHTNLFPTYFIASCCVLWVDKRSFILKIGFPFKKSSCYFYIFFKYASAALNQIYLSNSWKVEFILLNSGTISFIFATMRSLFSCSAHCKSSFIAECNATQSIAFSCTIIIFSL